MEKCAGREREKSKTPFFIRNEERYNFPFAMSTLRHHFARLLAGTGDSWSVQGWNSIAIPAAIPAIILAAVKEPLPAGMKNRHCQKLEPSKTFTSSIAH